MNIETLSRASFDRAPGSNSTPAFSKSSATDIDETFVVRPTKRRRVHAHDDSYSPSQDGYSNGFSDDSFGEVSNESDHSGRETERGGEEQGITKLPQPMYDYTEHIYRCIDCAGEVCDGMCQFCFKLFSYEVRTVFLFS